MDKNINYVLEGKYKNEKISGYKDISVNTSEYIGGRSLSKQQVSSYTVIDENEKDQYSFLKGAFGVALLGGAGAVAGVNGKKKKEYLISIEWNDGEKSLILIDDEYYKIFVKSMF